MINIYIFLLKYEHESEIYQLPVPPEKMVTKVHNTNKKYTTLNMGEINILKDIGLREIKMRILLPNDIHLPFVQPKYSPNVILGKPIVYLTKFREFKMKKKPVQFLITRILPSGEEIFKGNIIVSLEEYKVDEEAGEEGDFFVDLFFREYVDIKEKILETLSSSDAKTPSGYIVNVNRSSKEPSKTYKVKQGDTVWKIAKRELNDEKKYVEIMKINNITEPKKLKIGTILKLP